jgi:hypothetical protein
MSRRQRSGRRFLPVAGILAVLLITSPVLGAKPDKADKPAKSPEIAKTLTGTIASVEDANGRATFTMVVGGVTWELSAGPKWFWASNNPLAAYVGESVEVAGTYHAGETELDVDTVEGKALRAEGKPPWAGGKKRFGSNHPGSKGKKLKANGRATAPGQLKDKSKPQAAAAD